MSNFTKKQLKNSIQKRGLKSPFFYFGLFSFVLLGALFFGSESLAKLSYFSNSDIVSFNSFSTIDKNLEDGNLFFNQKENPSLETPDFKIIQGNSLYGISTPRLMTTQTLGDIFGSTNQDKRDIMEYSVVTGDTIESISKQFNISIDTLLWANDLSKNSKLKTGQNLVILPVSGLVYVVKSGDTISEISRTYKSNIDDILDFNNLTSEGDIFIGDILIIPNGTMPKKSAPLPTVQTPLADSFFIHPTEGQITQGLHWYNGVDVANKCGTPIYAAASGTVQRARYGWNYGGGNQVTVIHSGNIVTYYGHLLSILVKPGDQINVGDRIGLMGTTGKSTGCHLHFEVIGAKNPLVKYLIGSVIKYK